MMMLLYILGIVYFLKFYGLVIEIMMRKFLSLLYLNKNNFE